MFAYTQVPHYQDAQILDLCVRKRPTTPAQRPTGFIDPATCQMSPESNSDDSEMSSEMYDPRLIPRFNLLSTPTKSKAARPFKAYLSDPMGLTQVAAPLIRKESAGAFAEFRERVLSQVKGHNGTNTNMRRVPQNATGRVEDPGYWEKRRKNNEAAKRSRDARRAKEDEIAIRCAFLEQENIELRCRLSALETERQRLHDAMYRNLDRRTS